MADDGDRTSFPKRHGTYMPLFENVHRHRKTHLLARQIAAAVTGQSRDSHGHVRDMSHEGHTGVPAGSASGGMPEWMAAQLVVAQLHRLICWCARESGSGAVGEMAPYCFAEIIGWRDPATEQAVYDAWMASGFIDDGGSEDARVHEYESYAAALNSARDRKRAQRARDSARSEAPSKAAEPKSASRDSHGHVTDKSHPSHGRGRDSYGKRNEENGSRKEKKETRSARPARASRAARSAPPAASIEPEREPESETAVAVIEAPTEEIAPVVAAPPAKASTGKAPTSAWVDEWNGHLSEKGLPQRLGGRDIGALLKQLRSLWEEWGSNQQADHQVRQVIGAWFASEWGDECGWRVPAFLAGGQVNQLVASLTRHQRPRPHRISRADRRARETLEGLFVAQQTAADEPLTYEPITAENCRRVDWSRS